MNLSRRWFLKGTAAVAAVPVALTGIAFTPTPVEAVPVVPDLKPNSDKVIVYYHDLWYRAETMALKWDMREREGIARARAMTAILRSIQLKNTDKPITLVIDDRIMPLPDGLRGKTLQHGIAYLPSVIIRVHVDGSVQFLKDRFHSRAAVSRKAQ